MYRLFHVLYICHILNVFILCSTCFALFAFFITMPLSGIKLLDVLFDLFI